MNIFCKAKGKKEILKFFLPFSQFSIELWKICDSFCNNYVKKVNFYEDSDIYFLFLILFVNNFPILPQSIDAAIGITKKGRIILRYRTIAPRLFTLNPMASNSDKEKKIQKKGDEKKMN